MWTHRFTWLVMLALVLVAPSRSSTANEQSEPFRVIVHPDNQVEAVSRDLLRDAYLRKTTEWSSGRPIKPIDLSSKFPVRDQFTQRVLRKTPAQLRTYWNQQIFSGKGVPPPEVSSANDVIGYVLANPGAVGYLPASVDPGRARVVRLE